MVSTRGLTFLTLCCSLVACSGAQSTGGSQATSAPSQGALVPEAMPVPAPLYADLFTPGRSFTYDVHRDDSYFAPEEPDAVNDYVSRVSDDVMTCEVTQASQVGPAWVSEVVCDTAGMLTVVEGYYGATAEGLWLLPVDAWPDETEVELDPERRLMVAVPVAVAGEGEESSDAVEMQEDGSWCRSFSSAMGDEYGYRTCFAAGRGITEASKFSGGGSYYSVLATQRP